MNNSNEKTRASGTNPAPEAVVVGLCGHGVGIVRDLHFNGVQVIALESNRGLPGVLTCCAEIELVPEINGEGLLDVLVEFAKRRTFANRPVLFLTNDRMVETLGEHAKLLQEYYRLSWAHAAAELLPLLSKQNIELQCAKTGLNYPRSKQLIDLNEIGSELAGLRYPIILKPAKPLSAFKTLILRSWGEIDAAKPIISTSMPVLAQEFIQGDSSSIAFAALYLEQGQVIARFEGRKLRSRPMGHTTIAIPEINDEVHHLAVRFFEGSGLSGPVSLEVKQDSDGQYWVIEPTVGRTDFWLGLCSANGVNLPLIEYAQATGARLPSISQNVSHVWINGERDTWAIVWLLFHYPTVLFRFRVTGLYLCPRDPQPFFTSWVNYLRSLPKQVLQKITKLTRRTAGAINIP